MKGRSAQIRNKIRTFGQRKISVISVPSLRKALPSTAANGSQNWGASVLRRRPLEAAQGMGYNTGGWTAPRPKTVKGIPFQVSTSWV